MRQGKIKRGFTLIELLVVVSIISLLSTVVLASLKDAREKAIASKTRAEFEEFIKALELYKADNGFYPYQDSTETAVSLLSKFDNSEQLVPPDLTSLSQLLSKYIPNTPKYPINSDFDDVWYQYQPR